MSTDANLAWHMEVDSITDEISSVYSYLYLLLGAFQRITADAWCAVKLVDWSEKKHSGLSLLHHST